MMKIRHQRNRVRIMRGRVSIKRQSKRRNHKFYKQLNWVTWPKWPNFSSKSVVTSSKIRVRRKRVSVILREKIQAWCESSKATFKPLWTASQINFQKTYHLPKNRSKCSSRSSSWQMSALKRQSKSCRKPLLVVKKIASSSSWQVYGIRSALAMWPCHRCRAKSAERFYKSKLNVTKLSKLKK